jgi:hypothetical protein
MSMPQIDPAVYDAILNNGNAASAMDPEIAYQQKMAEYLRHTLGAPPQVRMSGRRAAAPGWMEMLGGLTAQGVAASKDRDVIQQQQAQQMLRQAQVSKVLEALKAQNGQGVPYTDPQGAP